MTADQFTVPEGRLADALGLPRKTIRTTRADVLEERTDWIYADNGAVRYSQQGIKRTLATLGIPEEKIAALLAPAPADSAPIAPPEVPTPGPVVDSLPNEAQPLPPLDLEEPDVVQVTVTRCFALNRHIVGGQIGADAVRVRVKSNLKLRPGMVLRCTHDSEDLYELAERLPRWPGKR